MPPSPAILAFDDADPETRAQLTLTQSACLLALGRLDGALSLAEPQILELFGYKVVRLTLIQSLASAGIADPAFSFDGWLSRVSGPPPSGPQATALPHQIARQVLDDLRFNAWAPIAAAADRTLALAPHLVRSGTPPLPASADLIPSFSNAPEDDLEGLVEQARILLTLTPMDTREPLAQLFSAVNRGQQAALFAPSPRERLLLGTDGPTLPYDAPVAPNHLWALNLALSAPIRALSIVKTPLPFSGAVTVEALRADLGPTVRQLAFCRSLTQTADALFKMLDASRKLIRRQDEVLKACRSTSRAPHIYQAIAGLGTMRRKQIAEGFGMTLAGADSALNVLLESGVVGKNADGVLESIYSKGSM